MILILPISIFGQNEATPLKVWYQMGLSIPVQSKFHIHLNQTDGYGTSPYENKFRQTSLNLAFNLDKRMKLSFGYLFQNSSRDEISNINKQRFFVSMRLRSKWNVLRISNSLKIEKHDQLEYRYDYRLVYSFSINPHVNLIARKINLTPFFNASAYYNIGGNKISQYDSDGVKIGKFTADGFHRVRLKTGMSITPVNKVKISIYGLYQREFNTTWDIKNHRSINVVNPKTGNITRSFQNYFVIGTSVKFYLTFLKN